MADDDSSELSSLSSLSPAPSDDESEVQLKSQNGILKFFHKLPKGQKAVSAPAREMSPPPPKRAASPPHEYVLADNPDIAFIVMFRSRFADAFSKTLANFGPQELEQEVVDQPPGDRVENFLCALLGLLLNRKQDVKPGHYNRALEEALQTHKAQWARDWEQKNPLADGATFATMSPTERLTLLRTLVLWTLSSSETVRSIIAKSYKQNRHDDDLNQPLSVQPWGSDSYKRRYFLVEGLDDTAFRVYRESNPQGLNRTWWSVAGSIDELKVLAQKLEKEDGGPKARKFAQRIILGVPRFEAGEEKRKRREYRIMRRQQFKRPEPGFSLYEGRTRGKRIKYTYSDDEDDFLTDSTTRRSTRNTRNHTPADTGPVTTQSGRQIRAPSRLNGETMSNGPSSRAPSVTGDPFLELEDTDMQEDPTGPTGRPRRSAAVNHGLSGWSSKDKKHAEDEYDSAAEDDEDEDSEPDFGDDEDEHVPDEEEDEEDEFAEADVVMDEEDLGDQDLDDSSRASIMVKLPVKVLFNKGKVVALSKDQAQTSEKVSTAPGSDVPRPKGTKPAHNDTTTPVVESPSPPHDGIIVAPKTATTKPPVTQPVAHNSNPIDTSGAAPSDGALPASLAFRGSPEKPHLPPTPINVGSAE